MRTVALDVHRDFCEVAIKEGGEVRSRGRIKTSAQELELFARSLVPSDQVALEATGPAEGIAAILEPHVARVLIANTRKVRAIAESKVKTDRVDARTLCELLDAGFLPAVWRPDEHTRSLRALIGRRERMVRSRTRAKNAVHAALGRNLKRRPPMSDVFGVAGRRWVAGLELPPHERRILESCLREVDFLSGEIEALERELARLALASEQIKRLMSVPGMSLVSAATVVAVVGDIGRFSSPRKLVSYVGLDPRVRQSGEAPARQGHISKQGSAAARHMLCEAPWIVVRQPGPLCAPSTSACGPGAARRSRSWRRRASSACSAGTCSPVSRTTPSGAPRFTATSCSPAIRRGADGARAPRRQSASNATSASSRSGSRPPTGGSSTTGSQAQEGRCGRDTGARILKASRKSQAARQASTPNLRFSSSSPAPRVTLAERRVGVQRT